MLKYIGRRLLMLIPVLLGVTFIVFSIMYMTPGDPAQLILGESAPPEAVAELRTEMGLDDPFIVQYGRFVVNAVQGDFGKSYTTKRDVFSEIFARFPNTLKLAGVGVALAIAIGIPVGIISATRQYSALDNVSMIGALLGVSMPNFWLGLMLILFFSVNLGWLPSSGSESFKHIILPAITLGTGSAAIITRMTRSSMLEVIRQDFIRTARAKGVAEKKVINKHALKKCTYPCNYSYWSSVRLPTWWRCTDRNSILMARCWSSSSRSDPSEGYTNSTCVCSFHGDNIQLCKSTC